MYGRIEDYRGIGEHCKENNHRSVLIRERERDLGST